MIVNGAGTKLWEDRYTAFGDLRYSWNSTSDGVMPMQTDMRYTGQRFDDAIGLYYYNTSFSGRACLAGMQQVESANRLRAAAKPNSAKPPLSTKKLPPSAATPNTTTRAATW